MRIIIVGAGFTGVQLASKLVDEKHDVVLVDRDSDVVRLAANRLDCAVVQADGNDLVALEDAGLESASAIVMLTDNDEYNMITCSLVDAVYPKIIKIARVRDYERYSRAKDVVRNHAEVLNSKKRPLYGIDYMIHPDAEAADSIILAIERGAVSDVLGVDSTHELVTLTISKGCLLDGKSLIEIRSLVDFQFVVTYVESNDGVIIPNGGTILREGDRIGVLSQSSDVARVLKLGAEEVDKLRRIVIFGANRIGLAIADYILHRRRASKFKKLFGGGALARNFDLYIVDDDDERCREACERFPDAKVLCGTMADDTLVREEGLDKCNLLIALSDDYERNIVAAAYMKTLGADRAVALVANSTFGLVSHRLGIDVAIPMRDTVVDSITGHLRGRNVRAIHTVAHGNFEIVECDVGPSAEFANKTLKEIAKPGEFLVLLVQAPDAEKHELPSGNTILRAGSHLFCIMQTGNMELLEKIGG